MWHGCVCAVDYACLLNSKKPAKDFIESLTDKKKAKLEPLIRKLCNTGKVWNKEKFRKLQGPIWELKSDKVRLLCFKEGNCWILTNGFLKKGQNTPRKHIDFAMRVRDEDLKQRTKK